MSEEVRFPRYLYYGSDNMVTVLGFIDETTEYISNRGYVDRDTGSIYVYDPKVEIVPSLILNDDGTIEKNDSDSVSCGETFNIANTYENSINTIIQATPRNGEMYNEEALADMNAATSIFVPVIKPTDDPLKKVIKTAIIEKGENGVDINRFKCRFDKSYILSNYRSGLVGDTKTSINVFMLWCDLLGVDFEITLKDNGNDTIDPLKEIIKFSSKDGKLMYGDEVIG